MILDVIRIRIFDPYVIASVAQGLGELELLPPTTPNAVSLVGLLPCFLRWPLLLRTDQFLQLPDLGICKLDPAPLATSDVAYAVLRHGFQSDPIFVRLPQSFLEGDYWVPLDWRIFSGPRSSCAIEMVQYTVDVPPSQSDVVLAAH